MSDLYGWILEQITAVEGMAREAEKEQGRPWATRWEPSGDYFEVVDDRGLLVADQVQPGAAGLIVAHSPAAVLRRCAADRRQLVSHGPRQDGSGFPDSMQCRTCSEDGGDGYQYLVPAPCATVRDLAEGYGWTGEGSPA